MHYDAARRTLVIFDELTRRRTPNRETARLLLQAHPDARVLMVSSLAYDDTINEANDIGAKRLLSIKPLTETRSSNRCRRLLLTLECEQ